MEEKELTKEGVYFKFYFITPSSVIPEIQTFIYLGENIYKEKGLKKRQFYFQDAVSYQMKGSVLRRGSPKDSRILMLNEDQLHLIHDLNKLIDRLERLKGEVKKGGKSFFVDYTKNKKVSKVNNPDELSRLLKEREKSL